MTFWLRITTAGGTGGRGRSIRKAENPCPTHICIRSFTSALGREGGGQAPHNNLKNRDLQRREPTAAASQGHSCPVWNSTFSSRHHFKNKWSPDTPDRVSGMNFTASLRSCWSCREDESRENTTSLTHDSCHSERQNQRHQKKTTTDWHLSPTHKKANKTLWKTAVSEKDDISQQDEI